LSYLTQEEKRAVILAGTNLLIEGVRERKEPAGKNIPLTSSFFAVQTAMKVAFQSGQFKLSNLNVLGNIYGITRYTQPSYCPFFARKILRIAKNREIDFVLKGDRIESNLTKAEGRKMFLSFLDGEYEYSISKNLVGKDFDAYAEVLVWHLLDDIYNFPRPLGYEKKLVYDVVNSNSKIKVDGQRIWDPGKLKSVPPMVDAWMTRLIETKKFEIVLVEEVGRMYSPPRFSNIDDRVLFDGPGSEICKEIAQRASRSPAWPVRSTMEGNFALKHLTSAGLIEYITEIAPRIRDYGYVVPRDFFVDIDAKLGGVRAVLGYKQVSDTALTELIFRSVGRARLAAHVLKSVPFETIDQKLKQLETGSVTYDKALLFILEPLELEGCIEKKEDEGKFYVTSGMMNDVKIMLDIWDILEFGDLNIPEEEFAKQKRTAQTRVQARNKAASLFI